MLFNSTIFLFVFLPLCGLGYWLILRFIGRYAAYAMLLLASLTFYAWWDIGNLLLLLSLILVNFFLGEHLRSPASQNSKVRRGWLIAGELGSGTRFDHPGDGAVGSCLCCGWITFP